MRVMKAQSGNIETRETSSSDTSLVKQWIAHEDESFHDLSVEDASMIREALLGWYRVHRRKLPWRGDPPPYSNDEPTTKRKKNRGDKNQTTIQGFFSGKTPASSKTSTSEESATSIPVEVSGYGVWVSEIMLQQTRVETVIPYYIQCKYL